MSKTAESNKIINLCEKYPDRFQSMVTYKASKNKDLSPADIEEINILISEMMTDMFYLLCQKLNRL